MEKYMEVIRANKVASVTRLNGTGQYEAHHEKHFFNENSHLAAWHTGVGINGVYTYDTDSLGRVIKSYHFDYPKTEEYDNYSVFILDSLGNRVKSEHFHASGERYHYKESFSRAAGNTYYITNVEAGKDSSVIRIQIDTIKRLRVTNYLSYQDGHLISYDSNFDFYNEEGKITVGGQLNYNEAFMAWGEEHPEDFEELAYSMENRLRLIDAAKLDTTLYEYDIEERYTYYENGEMKRAEDYLGIREYRYDARGFPTEIKELSDYVEEKIEAVITFHYAENGLLTQEITTLPDGTVRQTLNYDYTFW